MIKATYTKYTTPDGTEFILRVTETETSSIPVNFSNSDYQTYLAWLENPEAEQSTPIVVEHLTEIPTPPAE